MAAGGRRGEIDAKIKAWERDLERLRVAFANASDEVNVKHRTDFVGLYRRKEIVKSRWEAIRGVYRPDAAAVQSFDEALAAMEAEWFRAHAMLEEACSAGAA
ncbi:MAG: hypothetical protein EHM71_10300 [Zetaproteobacteria bacterium]|nr:MAG: hypothetical protein EHM71_10300 [Zetaproteobacteria bacterium]